MKTALYLIPVTLGETEIDTVLPPYNKEIILNIRHFIVENVRTARRFLKKVDRDIDIDTLTFYTLNKHTSPEDISGYLKPLAEGNSMGVISEAGCPAVADPGADVVAIAQHKNLNVVPLVGPSSILLAIMGSGFNGQSFSFHGYLPIDSGERIRKLKSLEQGVYSDNQTQLFIETPYRNNKMLEDILQNCRPQTKLCIAANLTCEDEYIKTKSIKDWQKKTPDLNKVPCIFLLFR
ncbi:SAM-dependent methyltransferase [Bacteroides sp. 519]|uniref:SAM-dependent methyltransferase n=1 Tax=Bacteroides sp. 519 TaxID=2302937 RepID=UPI0013D87F94|nr:SAM-dependent methyltransferase [Bacteroides sp. 519]NDV58935.1 SAM-dependent methyltransferase [Bacteroides sp. 519]